jgi:ATP-binding cassette subfamily B protein
MLSRIFKMAKPFWGHLVGLLLLGLLATPIALLKPYALKLLIDSGFGQEPLPSVIEKIMPHGFSITFDGVVILVIVLVILLALFENLYGIAVGYLNTYTSEKMVFYFRNILFNHMQRLSLAYHDGKGASETIYRIQYDVAKFKTFLLGNLSSLINSSITLISMLGVMFYLNWRLALVSLVIVPPLIFLTRLSRNRLKKDWKIVRQDESRALSVIHEVISSLRVVKAFGQEENENERFAERSTHALQSQLRVARAVSYFSFAIGMLMACGTALFFYFGAHSVHDGYMTLGELTLVISYLAQVFGPINSITKQLNDIQSTLVSIERVLEVLDHEPEVTEWPEAVSVKKAKGDFEFRKVSFHYKKEKPVLEDISFFIRPGDRVGIKGPTGAGKSTLINLLYRFYDPASGEILLDGLDIRKYKIADYRRQFSIVLQEPVLFSTTIEENIRYGRPDATRADIEQAARAANAHDFIVNSPEGYQTMVGERGMQLSGGERQRISIARAFIKNAPILILDEPTSSVDVNTEARIMEAMDRLMKDKTTFMITHRLSTLEHCNVIMTIENGRLIEVQRGGQKNDVPVEDSVIY